MADRRAQIGAALIPPSRLKKVCSTKLGTCALSTRRQLRDGWSGTFRLDRKLMLMIDAPILVLIASTVVERQRSMAAGENWCARPPTTRTLPSVCTQKHRQLKGTLWK